MTDATEPDADGAETEVPVWDAVAVMRARAAATRQDRDAAIDELREAMSDEQIRDEYGIDLNQIEE
jgi:hypothetical protein